MHRRALPGARLLAPTVSRARGWTARGRPETSVTARCRPEGKTFAAGTGFARHFAEFALRLGTVRPNISIESFVRAL